MSIFQDKKYESLDWLSQAMQPIESPMNATLAALPDEIIIDYDYIVKNISYNHRITSDNVITSYMSKLGSTEKLSWEERMMVRECFKIEMPDNVVVDFENKTVSDIIKVVKKTFTFEDADLQKTLGHKGLSDLRYTSCTSSSGSSISRLNEIIQLVSSNEEILKNRSFRKKIRFLYDTMRQIFSSNEWNIRDTDLADKVCMWAREYIEQGTLSCLTNFCKVKIMTHNGAPIYSIVEEQ